MRPEDLARELGIDGKRLRAWLRGRWPRRPSEHGQPWFLSDDQVAEARQVFANQRPRVSRAVARGWPSPLAPVATMAPEAPASEQLSWRDVQRHADAILASGLRRLLSEPAAAWGPVALHGPGVYLFADASGDRYIGESAAVSWRVARHVDPRSRLTATLVSSGIADLATDLRIRSLPVSLGRLELEEFAIACLRPTANLMRRLSRQAAAYEAADLALWHRVQSASARLLAEGVTIAEHAASVDWQAMEPPAGAGFYIVRDRGGTVLYVGETDDLAERLRTHSRRRSYFSALRRHVATELLGLVLAPDVGRGFTAEDEIKISAFLATCTIAILPLSLGRWELERELVRRLRPMLNREHA